MNLQFVLFAQVNKIDKIKNIIIKTREKKCRSHIFGIALY